MTSERLQTFAPLMSPAAFHVAKRLVEGAKARSLSKELGMGADRLYRLIHEAEAAVGERLRADHGHHIRRSLGFAGPKPAPRVKVPRCPKCGLRGSHECIDVMDFSRQTYDGGLPCLSDGRAYTPRSQ